MKSSLRGSRNLPSHSKSEFVDQRLCLGCQLCVERISVGASAILSFPSFQASWRLSDLVRAKRYVKSGQLSEFFRSMEEGIVDIDAAASGAEDVFQTLIATRSFGDVRDWSDGADEPL